MLNKAIHIVEHFAGRDPVLETNPSFVVEGDEAMKAITWSGLNGVACSTVAKPHIRFPWDVVIHVLACSICSNDLRMYTGDYLDVSVGDTMGHEAVGVVVERGDEVKNFKIGDRVVVAVSLACGQCDGCLRGEYAGCRETMLSYPSHGDGSRCHKFKSILLGNVSGSQAQFMRVPAADINCFLVPESISSEMAVLAVDMACSALHGVDIADVKAGDVVCIWGLGPVGLTAIRWCQLRGVGKIVTIDSVKERLDLALQLGSDAIDRTGLSSSQLVDEVMTMIPNGADVCIDATSFRPSNSWLNRLKRATQLDSETSEVLHECLQIARPFGRLTVIGDYVGSVNQFPLGLMLCKSISIVGGPCSTQKYLPIVMTQMEEGFIDPRFFLTHKFILEDAPLAYQLCLNKASNAIKIIFELKVNE
jgi:threonine dehydrogenase-like Zn-dependent dehydrogenase